MPAVVCTVYKHRVIVLKVVSNTPIVNPSLDCLLSLQLVEVLVVLSLLSKAKVSLQGRENSKGIV